ncbi:unnamed protein product [Orchesella dallaii]|uniref:CUB domain-containing protein n=1 Tax=Orchesella dallaii TaxID=48710 RepID=A0ABP1S824_9HEXA
MGQRFQYNQEVSNSGLRSDQSTTLLENAITGLDSQVDQLSDDYEETNFLDIIAQELAGIYQIEGECGGVLQSSRSDDDYSATVVMGPRAMVKFFSDQSSTTLGFRIYFKKMLDLDTTTEAEGDRVCNSLVRIFKRLRENAYSTSSLNQGIEEESLVSVAMRLSWKHGVFRRANQHCEYDTITIYSAPKISSWNLVSRFPTANDTFNCPDIVTVMAKELRTSMYPMFLAVFKPVASYEIARENDEATSFAFTYEKGPLIVVTFTSDRSRYGHGFRLHFRMEKRTTETDDQLITYKLFHQNRRFQNEFAYRAEPNQIAIVAFSSGIRRAGRNQIDVTSFRPQVNESCSSDSLLVYDVYGRVGRTIVLTKNFTAEVSNVEETHMDGSTVVRRCTALVNSQLQTCINNENCHAPVGGSFRTKSSSFLAIYNSVNSTGSSEYGGFELASKMI